MLTAHSVEQGARPGLWSGRLGSSHTDETLPCIFTTVNEYRSNHLLNESVEANAVGYVVVGWCSVMEHRLRGVGASLGKPGNEPNLQLDACTGVELSGVSRTGHVKTIGHRPKTSSLSHHRRPLYSELQETWKSGTSARDTCHMWRRRL